MIITLTKESILTLKIRFMNKLEQFKDEINNTKVERKLKLNKFIQFYYFIDFSEDFDTAVEQFNRLK